MSSLTDMIEATILDLMEAQDGACEIARNAFAAELRVAPSQISYVISTRFSHRQGYLVESRRGGSGYVRIQRLPYTEEADYLMHLAKSLADSLSQHEARVLINQLKNLEIISVDMGWIMKAALADDSLKLLDPQSRDRVRAQIFHNILIRLAALTGEEVVL